MGCSGLRSRFGVVLLVTNVQGAQATDLDPLVTKSGRPI